VPYSNTRTTDPFEPVLKQETRARKERLNVDVEQGKNALCVYTFLQLRQRKSSNFRVKEFFAEESKTFRGCHFE
jgi:hypothetical protein